MKPLTLKNLMAKQTIFGAKCYLGDRLNVADVYNEIKNLKDKPYDHISFYSDKENDNGIPTHHISLSYSPDGRFSILHTCMPLVATPLFKNSIDPKYDNTDYFARKNDNFARWYCEQILGNPKLFTFIHETYKNFNYFSGNFSCEIYFKFDSNWGELANRYVVEHLFRLFGAFVCFHFDDPKQDLKQHVPSLQRLGLAQVMKTGTPEEKDEAMFRSLYTEDKNIPRSAAYALEKRRQLEREINAADSLPTTSVEKEEKQLRRRSSRSRSPSSTQRRSSGRRKSRRVDTSDARQFL